MRFAFYGRVSTEDHQDPATSKAWQLLRAQALTSGHGRVVAEFFDVGHTRALPWARRPDAAALVEALADPDRGFDAIVIGSSERAFYGQQFATMAPLFAHYGVSVWVPELGGEVDPDITSHDELMVLLGILSKREVGRAQVRARTAMTVQARDQGRYLGGRPPYGYRLVDAGPHPNRALARRGVRLQQLDIDPDTGPVVTWIFHQRLADRSMARITRALNDMNIPCLGAADRARNPHRTAELWTFSAIHAILTNPRYTGHQVWNRQRTDHDLIDPDNTTLGHRDVMRRNTPDEWVISAQPAHPALVSDTDFVAVQGIRADTSVPRHTYRLAGLLRCAHCRRPPPLASAPTPDLSRDPPQGPTHRCPAVTTTRRRDPGGRATLKSHSDDASHRYAATRTRGASGHRAMAETGGSAKGGRTDMLALSTLSMM